MTVRYDNSEKMQRLDCVDDTDKFIFSTTLLLPGRHTIEKHDMRRIITVSIGELAVDEKFYQPGKVYVIEAGKEITLFCEIPTSFITTYD